MAVAATKLKSPPEDRADILREFSYGSGYEVVSSTVRLGQNTHMDCQCHRDGPLISALLTL